MFGSCLAKMVIKTMMRQGRVRGRRKVGKARGRRRRTERARGREMEKSVS